MKNDYGGKLMKNSFRGAIILLLILSILLFPDEKRIKIGECHWYTGQSKFEDILTIARERKQPVLVFYSASWCGPSQRTKRDVLAAKEFEKVEKEAVLLFVEFTEKGGKKFIETHKISKFPTFKLFSPEGVDLDTEISGDDNVSRVLQWVKQVKKRSESVKRLEKNPGDWDVLFQVTENTKETMYSSDQHEPAVTLLRNALESTDNSGKLKRQKARERLADYLYLTMKAKQGNRSRKYAQEHKNEFTQIIQAYYPDRYLFELKKHNPLGMWINWLTTAGDFETSVRVFEESLSRSAGRFDTVENINLLEGIIKSYLALDREKQAEMWIKRIGTAFTHGLKKGDIEPTLTFTRILLNIIEHKYNEDKKSTANHYIEKLQRLLAVTEKEMDGDTLYKNFPDFENVIEFFYRNDIKTELRKVAAVLKRMIHSFQDPSCRTFVTIRLAKKYGVFVDEALNLLANRKRNLHPGLDSFTIAGKAVLLSKKGEQKKARRLIRQMYEKIKNRKEMSDMSRSRGLNTLAWATFEMDAVDETSLQMAKESVDLDQNCHNLDTLATIYAELGNYREAVRIGRWALKLARSENLQAIIEEKVAQWGNMIE